jgi:hypothetical protein
MIEYKKEDFTWGYELELGDVKKSTIIPENLGSWEYCETDIVNMNPPYQYTCVDPAGINPPVGGEINLVPTKTWKEQVSNIENILEIFRKDSQTPTVNCISEAHIHIHVPGLREDIDGLKRLFSYIQKNQKCIIDNCVSFKSNSLLESLPYKATRYLKYDIGLETPDWMINNILELSKDFNDIIRILCCGKDGVSRGRPFRRCVNVYNMKHINTIEFRCFRNTLNLEYIKNCFIFVQEFVYNALNGINKTAEDIIEEFKLTFPPFEYDHEVVKAWTFNKKESNPKLKNRKFIEI